MKEKLIELRQKIGLTLRKASEISGVDYGTISRIESGAIKDPKYKHVKALLTAYRFDTKDFI